MHQAKGRFRFARCANGESCVAVTHEFDAAVSVGGETLSTDTEPGHRTRVRLSFVEGVLATRDVQGELRQMRRSKSPA